MPRRNPYHAGNSGQQLCALEEVEGRTEQMSVTEAGQGYSVVARRPRYGFPGDIREVGEASAYDTAMKPMLNYNEEE